MSSEMEGITKDIGCNCKNCMTLSESHYSYLSSVKKTFYSSFRCTFTFTNFSELVYTLPFPLKLLHRSSFERLYSCAEDIDMVEEEHWILTFCNGRMFSLSHFQFKFVNLNF